ncbi:hypothetical protein RSAG8_02520, partial [Rhizoctonia solani AG-8 WAC10335]
MQEIWKAASRVNADPNFMNNDPKTPWSEREERVRAHHVKRKKTIQAQWRNAMKKVLKMKSRTLKPNALGPIQAQSKRLTTPGTQQV